MLKIFPAHIMIWDIKRITEYNTQLTVFQWPVNVVWGQKQGWMQ